jgi:hypothetical protein
MQQLDVVNLDSVENLDRPLQSSPITTKTKRDIAWNLWGFEVPSSASSVKRDSLESYFRYYTKQSDLALHDFGRYAWVRTHQNVINIASLLKENLTRDQVKQQLRSHTGLIQSSNEDEMLDTSIDLTIRLLLMVEVGRFRNCFSGYRELIWECGSLQEFVADSFRPR